MLGYKHSRYETGEIRFKMKRSFRFRLITPSGSSAASGFYPLVCRLRSLGILQFANMVSLSSVEAQSDEGCVEGVALNNGNTAVAVD